MAPGWLPSPPTGKVAPLVKSNYRLTDEFSAALPLNSLKPLKRSLDHLICLAPGEVGGPFLVKFPELACFLNPLPGASGLGNLTGLFPWAPNAKDRNKVPNEPKLNLTFRI